MRRILAQARKELTQIFRDRLALVLALVLPLILLFLLGTTLSLNVHDLRIMAQKRLPLAHGLSAEVEGAAKLPTSDTYNAMMELGLVEGDLLVSINGRTLETSRDIFLVWNDLHSGKRGVLDLVRDGQPQTFAYSIP